MSYHDIEKIMNSMLGMFDDFEFGCRQCGKCCHRADNNTIIIAGYDLYAIAKYKNMKPIEIMEKYCFLYQGSDSKMPILGIKPRTYDNSCPFLSGKKCDVHPCKPLVCRLFPIGRMLSKEGQYMYFLQKDVKCGRPETHTVKEWLQKFNIEELDHAAKKWGQAVMDLAMYVRGIKDKKQEIAVVNAITFGLYVNYNTDKDYEEELEKNLNILETVLPGFKRSK